MTKIANLKLKNLHENKQSETIFLGEIFIFRLSVESVDI